MDNRHSRPAGYAALVRQYSLRALPNWHESAVAPNNTHRTESADQRIRELYPLRYWPGDSLGDHLEFALKHDGANLHILARLFETAPAGDLVAYIRSRPTGKYARRIWYLYELLTGTRLPIEDLNQGNYIELLDPEDYYTATGTAIQRQRIRDNLLGNAQFCPMVRRTQRLQDFERAGLEQRGRQIMESYPVELLKRALGYLYTRETKSSFEIEHIKPDATRTERFIALLRVAEREDFFSKAALVELQNRIADPRFQNHDFRTKQNYVGQTVAWQRERIHFVSPKSGDLQRLMEGLFASHQRMGDSDVHPVVHAAVVAYGFVFMHPFEDGNGRIHRFLIHNILARRGFTPKGIMFPVSAVMLRDSAAYDASLEAFSVPLMSCVEYELDDQGQMAVRNETAACYRYIDLTAQTEALFHFIAETIETELVDELTFLVNYDRTKRAIQEILDMPDRSIDLFIRLCLQNRGRLSQRKREDAFPSLTDAEVARMEAAVQAGYQTEPQNRLPQ
jgi:Fic family protein